MRRRSLLILIVFSLLFTLFLSFLANGKISAQAQHDNLIWCSLWQGANFDLDNGIGCPTEKAATPKENTSSSQTQAGGTYVSLGDSVAAGLGLATDSAATSDDIRCGRSSQAYPQIVANKLGLQLTNLSCSGATAGDLVTSQSVPGPNLPAQLDTAFASGTPAVLTITAGANDARWEDFIRTCYAFDCDRPSYTLAANAYISALEIKLRYAFASIQTYSAGGSAPQTAITGYYNPLSAACAAAQQEITADELGWLAVQTNALNQAIQNVSDQYSFVTFVPIDFTGHDMCSSDPWVQGTSDIAPFHPTAEGQQAIANQILRAL